MKPDSSLSQSFVGQVSRRAPDLQIRHFAGRGRPAQASTPAPQGASIQTRRSVLWSGLILPAAAIRGTAANSAVTVGLIGCGNRGTFIGQTLNEHTQAQLIALCDLYPDAIARARQK